jgi:integrase
MKLTQDRIRKLAHGQDGVSEFVPDDEQKGLLVRVQASGAKVYYAQYQHAGRKVRMKLGAVDALSLAAARKATREILGEVARGKDPAADRKQEALAKKRQDAHDALTLAMLIDQWASLRLRAKRPSYRDEAPRAIRRAFKKYLAQPAATLNRKAAVRELDRLIEAGSPVMAARAGAYLSSAYAWAVERGTLDVNPFAKLPKAPTVKRDRVLTDEEVRAMWKATEAPSVYNAIVRMLLLTGQRREEVADMAWSELSPDSSTWTIPADRAKNHVANLVPLSAQARAIIAAQPHRDGARTVFATGAADRPLRGFSWFKEILDKTSEVKDWHLHDLRRTVATGLQKLGVRLEVTEAILNHVSGSRGGIVGVYQRHDWAAEKKAALQAWADRVQAIAEGRAIAGAANVVALRA